MFSTNDLLLLLISYQRKANHPTENDTEIQAGVMADLAKIKRAQTAFDVATSNESAEIKAFKTAQAEEQATALESA